VVTVALLSGMIVLTKAISHLPWLRLAATPLLLLVALLVFRQRHLPGRNRKLSPVPMPTVRGQRCSWRPSPRPGFGDHAEADGHVEPELALG
jgi:hypothetical protein